MTAPLAAGGWYLFDPSLIHPVAMPDSSGQADIAWQRPNRRFPGDGTRTGWTWSPRCPPRGARWLSSPAERSGAVAGHGSGERRPAAGTDRD